MLTKVHPCINHADQDKSAALQTKGRSDPQRLPAGESGWAEHENIIMTSDYSICIDGAVHALRTQALAFWDPPQILPFDPRPLISPTSNPKALLRSHPLPILLRSSSIIGFTRASVTLASMN